MSQWDIVSLHKYLDVKRAPRGLRLTKRCSFLDDDLRDQWYEHCRECSRKWMSLIISQRKKRLLATFALRLRLPKTSSIPIPIGLHFPYEMIVSMIKSLNLRPTSLARSQANLKGIGMIICRVVNTGGKEQDNQGPLMGHHFRIGHHALTMVQALPPPGIVPSSSIK